MTSTKTPTRRMLRKDDIKAVVEIAEAKLADLEAVAEMYGDAEAIAANVPLAFQLMYWEAQISTVRDTMLAVLSGDADLDFLTDNPHDLFTGFGLIKES